MHSAKLVALTQGAEEHIDRNAEEIIMYAARVSNPSNQNCVNTNLIKYCINHRHWSIFEMANMVLEINTTRAISPQILRHRSFSFQEFCLAGDARITICSENNIVQRIPIKDLYKKWSKPAFKARYARAYDTELERFITAPIKSVYSSGEKPVYKFEITTPSSTREISCTREHRVLTKEKGFVPFGIAYDEKLTVALNGQKADPLAYQDILQTLCSSCHRQHDIKSQGKNYGWTLGMTAKWGKITSQTYLGVKETYDIEMDHPTHNFVADGVVVHNSQRYAAVDGLGLAIPLPNLRTQDEKNRQASHDNLPEDTKRSLQADIDCLYEHASDVYHALLERGIAKECAREVLPIGTPTKLYMNGTLRSWITYISLREKNGTQLEHQMIAKSCKQIFCEHLPVIGEALGGYSTPWEL
jgi:thymidylate synthase ThyX